MSVAEGGGERHSWEIGLQTNKFESVRTQDEQFEFVPGCQGSFKQAGDRQTRGSLADRAHSWYETSLSSN